MRTLGLKLIYIILIVIGLALARWLIVDVIGAVKRAVGPSKDSDSAGKSGGRPAPETSQAKPGRLVRDPVSGTYIDVRLAVKADIGGETLYFESRENRDSYLKKTRSG